MPSGNHHPTTLACPRAELKAVRNEDKAHPPPNHPRMPPAERKAVRNDATCQPPPQPPSHAPLRKGRQTETRASATPPHHPSTPPAESREKKYLARGVRTDLIKGPTCAVRPCLASQVLGIHMHRSIFTMGFGIVVLGPAWSCRAASPEEPRLRTRHRRPELTLQTACPGPHVVGPPP